MLYITISEKGRINIMSIKRLILLIILILISTYAMNEECTTAVISGQATPDNKPILWKNRDSDHIINKIIYVAETPYSYIGIINTEDNAGRMVWAGLNSEGFAIMNSVAYNLPKEGEMHDLEGIIMADALRTCRTVNDFEEYIKKNIGPSFGSQANFGVIDAYGASAIFEVSNKEYKRLNTADTKEKYIINTNFARSGEKDKGRGYMRFQRASELFAKISERNISPSYIIQYISRDIGNALLGEVDLDSAAKLSSISPKWAYTNHSINRYYTSSAVIIHGKNANNKNDIATIWVMLGEPIFSIAVPLWVEAGEVPDALSKGDIALIADYSYKLKQIARPFTDDERKEYLDLTKLINNKNTGFLPFIIQTEKEILNQTETFLKTKHTRQELISFQNEMAEKALKTLKKIYESYEK
jgi:hypothetical protein